MMTEQLFATPPAFTRAMKLEAIEREIKYRRNVYARRVRLRSMTQEFADKQIAVMVAIAADYAPNVCDDCGKEFPTSAQPVVCADCEAVE